LWTVRGVLIERSSTMSMPEKPENLKPDAAEPALLIVSAVRYEGPVGKPYRYKNGKVTKGKNYRSKKAGGETLEFNSFGDFATWRKPLKSEYMLVSGTFVAVGEVPVVYKDEEGPGEVSASKKYLAHRVQPGILIGDIDFKDPDEVAGLYLGGEQPYKTKDEALSAFDKVVPEADDCALLICWSTSSNLFKGKKQVKGKGGIRFYLPVKDASKIPELLEIMLKRSWLRGEGWAFVDEAGKFQERGLVDTALERPTQPDYAAPDLRDGLTQDREWDEFDGDYLDPASVAPLTEEEEEQYQQAVASAKAALASEMAAQRKKWLAKEAKKQEKKGLSPKRAMSAAVQLLDNGVLFPTGSVIFDDGTEVSVLDLLTDGAEYDGKTCKDPVEPGYNGGASVGRYYWNDGEGPGIHSFAHGKKWYAIKHNAESAMAAIESGDDNVVSLALAQTAFASKSEELRLEKKAAKALGLGNNVTVFRADVASTKKRLRDKGGKEGLDAASIAALTDGRWPIDKSIPSEIFPAKIGDTILSHADNYKTMMAAYGYGCSYDVIKKEVCWIGPHINMNTDNAYLALFSKMKGLSALNGLPHGNADLNAHLPAIAEENQINPVREYLVTLEWDGQDRFENLVKAIEPHDTEIAEIALRVWFTGAAAACEHFETGLMLVHGARPSFEYVLALLGEQGVNKTKGFLGLVPKALGKYAKDGLSIKTSNKDSVKIAVSYWLVELGELDVTFGQGQIAELKAFLSTEADELRLPYAQGYSKFKRRTAFMGTVNQEKFLKDATGNRRYLAIDCTNGFPLWAEDEVDQLWAQAWARYVGGSQWWPTAAEQVVLDINAERFRQFSWAETRIREVFDFTRYTENNKRITATNLWAELCSEDGYNKSIRELKPQQLNELRSAMKKLWGEHGAEKRDGEQVIMTKHGTVKLYSEGGKNKGWIVPMTVDEVVKSDREKATQLERFKRVKAIIMEIRKDVGAKGKKLSVQGFRKRVLAALKAEFDEKSKTTAFPGRYSKSEWEIVFDEVIAEF
jgi:predicted P-loop ATPase